LPVSEKNILDFHRLCQGDVWDAEKYKEKEMVYAAIRQRRIPFAVSDVQNDCPGVSIDMIRHLLKQLKAKNKVKCLGRGKAAQWQNV